MFLSARRYYHHWNIYSVCECCEWQCLSRSGRTAAPGRRTFGRLFTLRAFPPEFSSLGHVANYISVSLSWLPHEWECSHGRATAPSLHHRRSSEWGEMIQNLYLLHDCRKVNIPEPFIFGAQWRHRILSARTHRRSEQTDLTKHAMIGLQDGSLSVRRDSSQEEHTLVL